MDDRDRAAWNILRFIKGAIMKKSRASSRITSGRLCRKGERSNETSCLSLHLLFLPSSLLPSFLPSFLPASSYFPPVFRLLETLPDQVFRAEIKPELREGDEKKIRQPVCSPSGRSPFRGMKFAELFLSSRATFRVLPVKGGFRSFVRLLPRFQPQYFLASGFCIFTKFQTRE